MNQTEMLRKLEWSSLYKAGYGIEARECPECEGIHPDDIWNRRMEQGNGHTETCELNRLINQPQVDCPIIAGVSFRHEGPRETYILGEFYDNDENGMVFSDAGEWEDRGDDFWFFRFHTQPSTLPKEKP